MSTEITGHLERITFHNPDTHFVIARLRTESANAVVSILGHLPNPHPGEKIRVTGQWDAHPKYGQQFRFDRFELMLPDSVDGIQAYLTSGLIAGLGAKTAHRLVRHFQQDTLSVIEKHPERLTEVAGIGGTTANRIAEAWQTHHALRGLMQFLQDIGVKSAYAAPLFKKYGVQAVDIIQQDPFRLADDLPRIGFPIADALFRSGDWHIDPEDRAEACVKHLLNAAVDQGHSFVYEDGLIHRMAERFDIDAAAACSALDRLSAQGAVAIEHHDEQPGNRAVFPAELFDAESEVAARIRAMQDLTPPGTGFDAADIVETVLSRLAIKVSDEQLTALQEILAHRVAIVTGGPGTGKTTLIRSIAALMSARNIPLMLAAPTGRAARRLSEVTRRETGTLHKLLGYSAAEGRFLRDRDTPLDTRALIVDEASMVDVLLMRHLLRALPMDARLVLVGDVYQLPSVGPGNVLSDLIRAGSIPVFALSHVFRQAKESVIVETAHRIRNGRTPELPAPGDDATDPDFFFIDQDHPARAAETVAALCCDQLPRRFGLDPVRDIQVITPMHKGEVGTVHLNQLLQRNLNPLSAGRNGDAGLPFYPGDKVMHLKNNYQKEVFNGDIGIVDRIDAEAMRLRVAYDEREVDYDFAELDELALGYAISVHKSQGSEYPAVIIPLLPQHYALLQRNLLYTAITRGRKRVVVVGSQKAVRIALNNTRSHRRLSYLHRRLGGEL